MEKLSCLSFWIQEEIFAVDVIHVLEVLHIENYSVVPNTPPHIFGITNFRGDIIPLVDARAVFGLEPQKSNSNPVTIVLKITDENNENSIVGAMVDRVTDVIHLYENQIKELPDDNTKYKKEYLTGMVKHQRNFVMLVNANLVFSKNELIE